tara:strand:+ start:200 stop:433 length:234 start_codon:yes stop_codon:yes gene_type:complete
MDINVKKLSDKELAQLYLFTRDELKNRKMSLKERKLKEQINTKSHNVQSPMAKLAENKARPINKDARSIVRKTKKDS